MSSYGQELGKCGSSVCGIPAYVTKAQPYCERCTGEATNHGRFWDGGDREQVFSMYNRGCTLREIGVKFGRTQYGIACQLRQFGYAPDADVFHRPRHPVAAAALAAPPSPLQSRVATQPTLMHQPTQGTLLARAISTTPSKVDPDDLKSCVSGEDSVHDMTCMICMDLMSNPVRISACGHSFCSRCINRHTTFSGGGPGGASCPACRGVMNALVADTSLAAKISAAVKVAKNRKERKTVKTVGVMAPLKHVMKM